ncbi:hypothetical protein MANES_06G074800v8 [Manihot esculenta]|uniref:Uncharacterized protein n=1 Tax=Manihot esculenta TaxID=3983 RepID=A0A2C9VR44_MANES|nr:hypothetical protein MANES_06G074800v8 [Manihot esculenta]
MASLKAEKPVGTQISGQGKKEPAAKATDAPSKSAASKSSAPKKAAPNQSKKKGKGGKSGKN